MATRTQDRIKKALESLDRIVAEIRLEGKEPSQFTLQMVDQVAERWDRP